MADKHQYEDNITFESVGLSRNGVVKGRRGGRKKFTVAKIPDLYKGLDKLDLRLTWLPKPGTTPTARGKLFGKNVRKSQP